MIQAWQAWLRTVRGQLSLLAATFVGAVVLAVVIVCLREVLFERYVREVYPPATSWANKAAKDLSAREISPTRLAEIRDEALEKIKVSRETKKPAAELEELYGAWVQNSELDHDGLLSVRLTQFAPDWVISRLRRTLAAGNPEQRIRALQWLLNIANLNEVADPVRELATQAQRRAAARGEESIRLQAEAVLANGRRVDE